MRYRNTLALLWQRSSFFENLPSIVFTTLSVPPVLGDRNPQGREDVTALLGAQNRYALRLAGHQSLRIFCGMGPPGCCGGRANAASKPSPCCAGWDRLGIAVYSLQLIVYSLRLISWLLADNLQISCDSLGGFEEKA